MMGVLITPSGYQFMQYHSGQWEPVTATRLAAQSSVPKQVHMILLPVSSIWQKEDILELEHHRLTLNDIELELKKEEKGKRHKFVTHHLNRLCHSRFSLIPQKSIRAGRST